MFESCESLTEITIPAGVSSIDIRAFRDCKNLKEITIPASVTRIEDDAFDGCVNLTFFGAKGSAAENYAMDYDNISFQKLRGDLDNSVTITAEDAQLALIAYLKKLSTGSAGLSKAEFTIADVDENGILNADDAQHILIYATHILAGLNPKWDDIIIF